jgi:DNA repair exonuclease SbcCD ATPase subunit
MARLPKTRKVNRTVVKEGDDFSFFGEVDRNKEGLVGSEYPSWAMNQQLDDLREGIEQAERQLEDDLVPPEKIIDVRHRLKKEKERYEDIMGSKPKMGGKQIDELAKVRQEIGAVITDSMFTRTQMMTGTADAHEEASRMADPRISLNESQMRLAKSCGINPVEGKINRTQAERMWKISSRYLGEPSNTEVLRRND